MRYDDDDTYTAADARYDEWAEKQAEQVQGCLTVLVDAVMDKIMDLEEKMEEARVEPGFTDPHPWTWERSLLGLWDDEENGGEDAVRDLLSEQFKDEAEEDARNLADDDP